MNKYILIRRLTGPSILLLVGVVALLHQADMVSWNIFLPLLLILIGVLKLAQRAALAAAGDEPMYPGYGGYPGGYPGAPYAYGAGTTPQGAQTPAQTSPSIVPPPPENPGGGSHGGQQ